MAGVADIHQLSQAAYDRLAAEHEQLITHGRTDIARKIQAARELGDLKENGDYHAAKEEQGKMEGRINHLAALLLDCEIVEAVVSDTVQMGSIVTIRFEDDDDSELRGRERGKRSRASGQRASSSSGQRLHFREGSDDDLPTQRRGGRLTR